MTCIVAIRGDSGVVMGADSCAGGGCASMAVRAPKKVAKVGEFLVGYTSSFRMGQILHSVLSPAKHNPKDELLAHIVTVFVPEIRRAFKDQGWLETVDGRESGGEFLLAHGTRLFFCQSDFSVLEYDESFAACGCAREIALGALFALSRAGSSLGDRDRLSIGLSAAAEFSAYVKPPFHFEQNF